MKTEINKDHNSPYDMGARDCYYGRPYKPNKRVKVDKFNAPWQEREVFDLTEEEINEYRLGWDSESGSFMDKKNWD